MDIKVKELTIVKAHEHLKKGDFTAVELADVYLKEAESKNKDINAFIEIFNDVKDQAEKADKIDRKSTRLNSSHIPLSRMPSSA